MEQPLIDNSHPVRGCHSGKCVDQQCVADMCKFHATITSGTQPAYFYITRFLAEALNEGQTLTVLPLKDLTLCAALDMYLRIDATRAAPYPGPAAGQGAPAMATIIIITRDIRPLITSSYSPLYLLDTSCTILHAFARPHSLGLLRCPVVPLASQLFPPDSPWAFSPVS